MKIEEGDDSKIQSPVNLALVLEQNGRASEFWKNKYSNTPIFLEKKD